MNSYLSLIPISARIHRRQNRLTRLCILFAVFMMTAVFSMAEMGARMEQNRLLEKHPELSVGALFGSEMGRSLLAVAAFLFVLVLIAGVLMISGSISSGVAQRTRFFGMMRCLGMSREQITRFVTLEALNWCKTAIPLGLFLGTAASWGLCAALRYLVGEEFTAIPLFGISGIGLFSGVAVGLITVLLAARAPARRAARVSPMAAVTGAPEMQGGAPLRIPLNKKRLPIEVRLGIHHAMEAKKPLFLITGSFVLSILLFLSFSVMIDFVGKLLPQSAAASDLDIVSRDTSGLLDPNLAETLREMPGVKRVYGRRSTLEVEVTGGLSGTVDLISFDDFDLQCLKKDGLLKSGSLAEVYGDSNFALATWDPDCSWEIGDRVSLYGQELEIAGLLNCDPFSQGGLTGGKLTLIVSGETFIRLTGQSGYNLLMVQTTGDATDQEIASLRDVVGNAGRLTDKRDQSTAGTYLAFLGCVYAFLLIITLVTVLNIINSISMSVSARWKQYGAMRAVGMENGQIVRMIAAEAFTYALLGCFWGCVIGLPIHRFLYQTLITAHFPYALWNIPTQIFTVILLVVLLAATAAIVSPARRLRQSPVTQILKEP